LPPELPAGRADRGGPGRGPDGPEVLPPGGAGDGTDGVPPGPHRRSGGDQPDHAGQRAHLADGAADGGRARPEARPRPRRRAAGAARAIPGRDPLLPRKLTAQPPEPGGRWCGGAEAPLDEAQRRAVASSPSSFAASVAFETTPW